MESRVLLLVAVGGAFGAAARYAVSELFPGDFPWGTLSVNLLGSLMLGILMGASISTGRISPEMMLFLGVGVLGAFTTMSTFSIDIVEQFENGLQAPLLCYIGANMVVCPLLAFGGWRLAALLLA